MTMMAENVIAAGATNRPPMLEKSMYNSWQCRMLLYIRGKEHGKDLLDSVLHGPFQYGIVVENGITRPRTFEEVTNKKKIHNECDIRATNIVLQGLFSDVYNLVNHRTVAKEIWDTIKLLMEGTKLLLQEPESPVHQQPYHDHVIHSPPVVPQQAYQAPEVQQKPQAIFPQLDSGLAVPSFLPSDDPIASFNKAMAFISTSIALCQSFAGNGSKSNATSTGDPGVSQGPDTQTTFPINAAFQTDDLDAFDSNCDEAPSAREMLMANLSIYDSNVISKLQISDTFQDNYVLDHYVQEMYYYEQPAFVHTSDIETTSDSNVIDEMSNQVAKCNADFDKGLHVEINEMNAVFNQMEFEVEQYIVHTAVNSYAAIVDYEKMEKRFVDKYNECLKLQAELSKKNEMVDKVLKGKDTSISNLKKHIANLKGKEVAPGMYKLDLQPLSSTLRKNKEVHEDYLKVLLVCVNASCPSSQKDSEKPVAAKTKNRNRRVTFEDNCDTSVTKTQKHVESQSKQTTIKPLFPSTGVISSTSASGSKSKSNTRKNRITHAASSNQKNKKVEDHPRSVMSSLNKNNYISICNASTKHVVFDANSRFVCSTCNDCLFSTNHDKCVVAYLNDVNSRVKSKSGKSIKKEWKSTSKVFTSVRHRWLPTGRTFTIDGKKCPMTRITYTKVVPPWESIQTIVITKKTIQ
ncbi:hypothetical protein Tco_1186438 [Tanacetum coccineum]